MAGIVSCQLTYADPQNSLLLVLMHFPEAKYDGGSEKALWDFIRLAFSRLIRIL